MAQNSHAVMSSALAKALIAAGVTHFDGGGVVGGGGAGGVLSDIGGALTTQNTFNANQAPTTNLNYAPTVGTAQSNSLAGYGNAQSLQGQQQSLANSLLAQSQGQGGPGQNAVNAQLAQNTGNNAQMQAALMASQRGAASNPALLAREASMAGTQAQQQSVGQAAQLQAQQQLAAQGQLQNQQAAMVGGNISEQGAQNQLLATTAGANNTQNANNIQNAAMAQGINSQVSQNNANAVNTTSGGLLNGLGGAIGSMFAKGGKVEVPPHLEHISKIYHPQKFAGGGDVGNVAQFTTPNIMNPVQAKSGKSSNPISSFQAQAGKFGPSAMPDTSLSAPEMGSQFSGAGYNLGAEGMAPAASGGVGALGVDTSLGAGAAGGGAGLADLALLKSGGKIGGKANVKGNSYKNDTVPALLSPGEEVLPRSVTQSKDAPSKAAAFVKHLQEKDGKKEDSEGGYKKVAKAKKSLEDRVKHLEKLCAGGRV